MQDYVAGVVADDQEQGGEDVGEQGQVGTMPGAAVLWGGECERPGKEG